MRIHPRFFLAGGIAAACAISLSAQAPSQQTTPAQSPPPDDPIKTIVSRLDLEQIQGDDQRPYSIRGSTAGHETQPRRGRLDRGTAQELRLHEHGAPQVRLQRPGARWPRRRAWRSGSRCEPGRDRPQAPRSGRQHDLRHDGPDRRQHGPRGSAGREAARAEHGARRRRPARGGLLHEDRHHPSRGDVHRRRPHGRARVG